MKEKQDLKERESVKKTLFKEKQKQECERKKKKKCEENFLQRKIRM